MITSTHGFSIRQTDPYRSKYDSAMAEYLDQCADMDSASGTSESPTGWFALFGRRVLRGDERGFVWVEVYPSADDAGMVYDALDDAYGTWATDEDYEGWPIEESAHVALVDEAMSYAGYVISCATEGLNAHSREGWVLHGRPTDWMGGTLSTYPR